MTVLNPKSGLFTDRLSPGRLLRLFTAVIHIMTPGALNAYCLGARFNTVQVSIGVPFPIGFIGLERFGWHVTPPFLPEVLDRRQLGHLSLGGFGDLRQLA
jgi:hypothetical protein